MSIDSGDWKRGAILLSMDLTLSFARDLWFPCRPPEDLTRLLQKTLKPFVTETMTRSDGSFAAHAHASILDNPTLRDNVVHWVQSVFGAGATRADQHSWSSVLYGIANRKLGFPVTGWGAVLEQFVEVDRLQSRDFMLRCEAITKSDLSAWDQALLDAEDISLENITDLITVIGRDNHFVSAWNQFCADKLSIEDLDQAYFWGLDHSTPFGSKVNVVFPGGWSIETARLYDLWKS
ncbi:MAG: hypothetical protein SGJ19_26030 [Planctomycetia bacterium]|nr:hypothetical protein [Planctomycetia bacterium]